MVGKKHMGAVHWKSPEYLGSGRPTFASDVYSSAMCILEAVMKAIPWGSNVLSTGVKYQLKKGRIPVV
uniref:Protein kinase domain-containing protein n=1 Tax=Globisporangium ultimum (strain ATCC 200006 / CBS 805.95 / DAOM BR144) TaxID=431595 RepID=K3W6G4_GLOUD